MVWGAWALLVAPLLIAQPAPVKGPELVRVLPLKGEVHHVQGIDFDSSLLWVTSVDTGAKKGYLHEFRLDTGELTRTVEVQDGPRFHPGGIAADAHSIWVPVAEYKRASSAVIQRRSKRNLQLLAQFAIADHIGCIAVEGSVLVGGNWDSRDLYVWDLRGTLIRKLANPAGNGFQDLKFTGRTLVGSGLLPDKTGAIDWIEYPSMRPFRRLPLGKTDRGINLTQEGMAIRGDRLFLLPEDGPSRLFEYRLE
jgi:hypothetical protein